MLVPRPISSRITRLRREACGQDVRRLAHLDHECRFAPRQADRVAPTRVKTRSTMPTRALSAGTKLPICANSTDQCHLPQIGALAGHVRSGQYQDLIGGRGGQIRIVGNEGSCARRQLRGSAPPRGVGHREFPRTTPWHRPTGLTQPSRRPTSARRGERVQVGDRVLRHRRIAAARCTTACTQLDSKISRSSDGGLLGALPCTLLLDTTEFGRGKSLRVREGLLCARSLPEPGRDAPWLPRCRSRGLDGNRIFSVGMPVRSRSRASKPGDPVAPLVHATAAAHRVRCDENRRECIRFRLHRATLWESSTRGHRSTSAWRSSSEHLGHGIRHPAGRTRYSARSSSRARLSPSSTAVCSPSLLVRCAASDSAGNALRANCVDAARSRGVAARPRGP